MAYGTSRMKNVMPQALSSRSVTCYMPYAISYQLSSGTSTAESSACEASTSLVISSAFL
jgi:hypothetical protein